MGAGRVNPGQPPCIFGINYQGEPFYIDQHRQARYATCNRVDSPPQKETLPWLTGNTASSPARAPASTPNGTPTGPFSIQKPACPKRKLSPSSAPITAAP